MLELAKIKEQAHQALLAAKEATSLEEFFRQYLGKKGQLAQFFESLASQPAETRKEAGQKANSVKLELERLYQEKLANVKEQARKQRLEQGKIDVTRPGQKSELGRLHPLTLVNREVVEIFQSMGFEVALGPEMETEWYNFDALNMPKDHPARDMQDTFWLRGNQQLPITNYQLSNKKKGKEEKSKRLLLRTQTSPVQVRYMEKHTPPLRIVAPGRIFRNEANDATHESQFHQIEGLMVDKDISAANFKAILEKFLSLFFGSKVKTRLRPSFFPFTEPSFEIDGCRADGQWTELMGAGMVNQNVFEAAGYPRNKYQGFAFGVGVERLAMVKYKINNIRLFYQNDLRFLRQF